MIVVVAHAKLMRAIEVIGIRVAPTLVGQAYRELRCASIHFAPAHRRCVRRSLVPSL